MVALMAQRVALPVRPTARLAASRPLPARAVPLVQRSALVSQPLVRRQPSSQTLALPASGPFSRVWTLAASLCCWATRW